MPFALIDNVKVHWQIEGQGDGPAIVLLHSIGTEMGIYERVVPCLADRFRLLLIDLRGHGQSQASEGEFSLSLLVSDVCLIMDAAGIEKAVICGTSLGGMIAMQFALDRPERISGMVLACTSAKMSPGFWPERIALVQQSGMGTVARGWDARHLSEGWMAANPERVESLERAFAETDPLGYIGCAAAIRDMDVLGGLPQVTAPTTIIAGEFDIATPYEGHADRIAAAMPAASVQFLPAGHLACLEQPELFANCVLALAARCAPDPAEKRT